jgi:Na+-driven multidrug efflux pump
MGLLMGFWGWIGFDIFTLIASYLSSVAISAQTIMRTLGLLTFMIPVGQAMATNVLLG